MDNSKRPTAMEYVQQRLSKMIEKSTEKIKEQAKTETPKQENEYTQVDFSAFNSEVFNTTKENETENPKGFNKFTDFTKRFKREEKPKVANKDDIESLTAAVKGLESKVLGKPEVSNDSIESLQAEIARLTEKMNNKGAEEVKPVEHVVEKKPEVKPEPVKVEKKPEVKKEPVVLREVVAEKKDPVNIGRKIDKFGGQALGQGTEFIEHLTNLKSKNDASECSPFDCGLNDHLNWKPEDPHFFSEGNRVRGVRVVKEKMTPEQVQAYHDGYTYSELSQQLVVPITKSSTSSTPDDILGEGAKFIVS
jgi:hypothetical protein